MTSTISTAICLAFLAAVAGCQTQVDSTPESNFASSVNASFVTAAPDSHAESDDPDERYKAFEARAAMRRAVRSAIVGAETWQEARAAAERAAAEHPDVPAFEAEQTVAQLMLTTHLLPGSAARDADRLDAIGDYTEALVRHRNPSAALIERSLAALDGHWAPDRTARAASAAYDAVERFVEIKADCEGCGLETIRESASRVSGPDAVALSLQRAMDGSEALRARF